MLQQVILKFPQEVVTEYCQVLYLPLVARLANEAAPKPRAAVAATLKLLHSRVSFETNSELASYCCKWLGGSSGAMRRAAAQALGVLAEAEGSEGFSKRLAAGGAGGGEEEGDGSLLPLLLLERLHAAADATAGMEVAAVAGGEGVAVAEGPGGAVAGTVPGWQEAYHLLLLLERVVAGGGGWLLQPPPQQQQQQRQREEVWGAIIGLLLHPHLWVRKVAGRLVGSALANAKARDMLLGWCEDVEDGEEGVCCAGELALLLYRQLDADVVDEGLCTQGVKCLVAVAAQMAVHEAVALEEEQQQQQRESVEEERQEEEGGGGRGVGKKRRTREGGDGWLGAEKQHQEEEEEDEEEEEERAQGEREGADREGSEGESEEEVDSEDEGEGIVANGHSSKGGEGKQGKGFTLRALLSRMVRLAEDMKFRRQLQRMAGLRFIAAVASAVKQQELLLPYLPMMLRPLYRISEAAAAGVAAEAAGGSAAAVAGAGGAVLLDEVKGLGEQVLEHLRGRFGTEAVLAGYTAARESVRAARGERKKVAARKALLDPEAAAQQQLKRHKRKAEGRQRKMDERRKKRGARGSGGFQSKGGRGGKSSRGGGGGKRRGGGGGSGGRHGGSKRQRR